VLDPFCGSGTTGEVALKLGRNFVGLELYDEYAEIAEERCRQAHVLRGRYEEDLLVSGLGSLAAPADETTPDEATMKESFTQLASM